MKEALIRNLNNALEERDTDLFIELLEVYYTQSKVYQTEFRTLSEKFKTKIMKKDHNLSWDEVKFLLYIIGLKIVRFNNEDAEKTTYMD